MRCLQLSGKRCSRGLQAAVKEAAARQGRRSGNLKISACMCRASAACLSFIFFHYWRMFCCPRRPSSPTFFRRRHHFSSPDVIHRNIITTRPPAARPASQTRPIDDIFDADHTHSLLPLIDIIATLQTANHSHAIISTFPIAEAMPRWGGAASPFSDGGCRRPAMPICRSSPQMPQMQQRSSPTVHFRLHTRLRMPAPRVQAAQPQSAQQVMLLRCNSRRVVPGAEDII
jgi:hypothetical protein